MSVLEFANSRFEDKFRYDEQGVPRIWKPSDDIDGMFKSARDDVPHLTIVN
jgi:protein SEY1